MKPQAANASKLGASEQLQVLAELLQPERVALITIASLSADELETSDLTATALPCLVIPADALSKHASGQPRAIVAVEGADRKMARQIASLLNPAAVALALVHVTWLPGTASSPLPDEGLDDPSPIDLLLYRGAREALIDTAEALRDIGFAVSTHLRENRQPADALARQVARLAPTLVVLGLGRHGAGIGRDLLREVRLPILYVNAR